MKISLLMFLLIFLLVPQGAYAAVYKWKDENGKVHFTDSPDKVPLKYRKKENIDKSFNGKPSAGSPHDRQSPEDVVKRIKERMGANIRLQGYNSATKADIYNVRLACLKFWRKNGPDQNCTLANAKKHGYVQTKEVNVSILHGHKKNFEVVGKH